MQQYPKQDVSVTTPFGDAIQRTKYMLFTPFDMSKWFIIGFCSFLASLGQGGSFNFGGNFSDPNRSSSRNFPEITNHLPLIITIAAIVFVIAIIIGITFCWFSSRGRFMFLHCVANNVAEVKIPWTSCKKLGNNLFLFRLAVGVILLLMLAVFGGASFVSVLLIKGQEKFIIGLVLFLILMPVFICVLSVAILTLKFTKDFIVPVMYKRRCTCMEAWHIFWPVLKSNKGNFTLYILFQILIMIMMQCIIGILFVLTCCCACCLTAIPYIGSVLLLPLAVFSRSYSLFYIRQYSPDFNVLRDIQILLD